MMLLKFLFRVLHHYAHALEIRSVLSSEYLRLRLTDPSYPAGLLRKIWVKPSSMEDLLQLSRFMPVNDRILLIDVGANTGYWAEAFVQVFRETSIVAFEPDSRAAPLYKERFKQRADVILHELALSDRAGVQSFAAAADTTFSSLEEYSTTTTGKSETLNRSNIATLPLDEIDIDADGFDFVFLKIDVQGHEVQVVNGARGTLDMVDVVLVELSFAGEFQNQSPTFAEVSASLLRSGLYPIVFQDYGRSRSPYAWERDVIFVKERLLDRIWNW